MAETGREGPGFDVAGLADLASPMHAVLARYGEATSLAGPAAGMLRLAARRFVAALRRDVAAAAVLPPRTDAGGSLVAVSVARGVDAVVAGYRAAGGPPDRSFSAVQGAERAAAAGRVRALVAAAAHGAERRLTEVRGQLDGLSKFVDGARVVTVGSGSGYPRLARAVLLASATAAASLTLAGGALAGPTQAEIAASRAGVSVEDLFQSSFGGMVRKPTAPVATTAPKPGPVIRVAEAGPAAPGAAFRAMAEAWLGARGLQGGIALDGLLADARSCLRDYAGGPECRIARDGVHVDLAGGRYEIRSPSGSVLVAETGGQEARVLDAAGFAAGMRPSETRDPRAPGRSVERKVSSTGKVYYEPSAAFRDIAFTILEMTQRDSNWAKGVFEKALAEASACATGPSRPEGCLVRAYGLALDMEKGRFSISAGWENAAEAKTLVVETREAGIQVPDPMALGLRMRQTLNQTYALEGTSHGIEPVPGLGGPRR